MALQKGSELLDNKNKLSLELQDISIIDKAPSIEGRSLSIELAPMGKVKG